MAISKTVISQVKNRITNKIKTLEASFPPSVTDKAKQAALKSLGLDKLAPKLEAAYREKKAADKKENELLAQVRKIVGSYIYGNDSMLDELNSRAPGNWVAAVKAEKAKLVAGTPQMQEISTLTKLRDNLEIKLELASSTKEVREALQGVLDALGEDE